MKRSTLTSPSLTGLERRILHFITLLAVILLPAFTHAKDTPVTAIALFDGPSGPAYVQIAAMTVNGKGELRVCGGVPKINKTAYDNLPKIQLSSAASLERSNDGTLLLNINSKPTCVVPSNLKFDRSAELTPAEAAEQAGLQGTVISSSQQGAALPAFKPGVRLVFVAAPDEDMAQFLLAQRVNSTAGWQDFLAHHESSAHAAEARNALAGIEEEAAESAFSRYEKSPSGPGRDLAALKQAQQQAIQANKIVPGYPAASKLRVHINQELETLLETDRARLQSFQKGLREQTPGYAQLVAAREHTEALLDVNPEYAPVLNLHGEVKSEVQKLESAVTKAEDLIAAKDYDQAVQALNGYRAFAGESPRIEVIVGAAYSAHFQRGRQFSAEHDWEKAVAEFRRAAEINRNSKEAAAELKDAEAQSAAARDRQAVQAAVAKSKEYADNKDFIEAYETLAELPDKQRTLVADQLSALQKDFVPAALRRAQKLQEIHIPIRGRADQDGAQEAYELLNQASIVSGDPAIKLRLDLLSDRMSSYYVDQARRYLDRPMGSGVGVGWLYLGEAEHYKPNLSSVKDAKAQYATAYQLRSKLSVGVLLRDQTSRRDSVGFADQLADAIANGLEATGLSVKVVRQEKDGAQAVQPNFLLVGEILEHRVTKDVNLETLPSKYRAGTHDIKNEEWTKANDDYSSAQKALQTAQRAVADAHGKKEAAAANDAVAAAQKALDDARHKLDATEPTRPQAVIEPYNYTKKNTDLTAVIDLAFRINDADGSLVEPGVPVKKEEHKRFVVLENVKPEDTEGVKSQGTEPDEARYLTDLEIQARDLLVKAVRDKAMALPEKLLQQARSRAQQNDVDGAAEKYIVYLNATAESGSPERTEAAKFLREHYNVVLPESFPGGGQVQAGIAKH